MRTAYSPQQLKSRVGTWFSPCVWRCVSRNMSQMRSYSSRADMSHRLFQRDRGRCTFGIVAPPRLRPMAYWPPGATGNVHGSVFRLREAADRRVHRLLDLGPPIHRNLLPGVPDASDGPDAGPADGTSAASPAAGTAPADGRPLATRIPILFAVGGPKGPFLPLPAVLLLLFEPREQSRRRTERPEFEDDLAMFFVFRDE